MATQAVWYKETPQAPERQIQDFRVRAIPNEDIFLFLTPVDNSRVVRPSNKETWNACWRFITISSAIAILTLGLLLPNAYSLLSGIRIHSLERSRTELLDEQKQLEVEESKLLRPERLEELARQMQFVDPPAQSVVYLDSKSDGTMAKLEGSH
jgi:cell division protein FtsL